MKYLHFLESGLKTEPVYIAEDFVALNENDPAIYFELAPVPTLYDVATLATMAPVNPDL